MINQNQSNAEVIWANEVLVGEEEIYREIDLCN